MQPNRTSPIVIGIAGGSGAGKTTFARAVYDKLGQSENIVFLTHDYYYKDITHLSIEERARTNFDHPNSLDTDLLIQHIQALKQGRHIDVPNYDFSTHARTDIFTRMEPRKIILVEGILILSDARLVHELDIKVYCDADPDVRFMRRLSRDIIERGRSTQDVIEQFLATVRPMHQLYVEPSKKVADIIVPSHPESNTGYTIALSMVCNHLMVEAGLQRVVDEDINNK